jgi:hypothetical protein
VPDNKWVRLLACATGLVNQRLLPQDEYPAAEKRIEAGRFGDYEIRDETPRSGL